MKYKPGLHILARVSTPVEVKLRSHQLFKAQVKSLIEALDLTCLGEIYHDFEPEGFTATVCLSESHLAIHTWPEHQMATFDVYLSNNLKDNTATCRTLYEQLLSFFEAKELHKEEVLR